jgi:hypothetical protein
MPHRPTPRTLPFASEVEDMKTAATQPQELGFSHEVLSRSWRETLVESAQGDSMAAALESARLLAADTASTPDAIYTTIQSFYGLDNDQTTIVMTRLANEMSPSSAQAA